MSTRSASSARVTQVAALLRAWVEDGDAQEQKETGGLVSRSPSKASGSRSGLRSERAAVDVKTRQLAKKLGAEVVGTVPDYSAGAIGVAKLEQAFREQAERRDTQDRVRQLRREWDDRP